MAGPVHLAAPTPGLGNPGPVPTPAPPGAARSREESLAWSRSPFSASLGPVLSIQALGKDEAPGLAGLGLSSLERIVP